MATSYNGWPASPDKSEIGIVKFGDAQGFPFPGGVKSGDVFTVLGYVATQLHNRVEPCVNGWCWGYTYKQNVNNPSQLSCHASGTAIDWNAPDHPNGSSNTFTDPQVSTIYDILAEVRGAVSWLQGHDEMHFEIAVSAGELSEIAASLPGTGPVPIPPPPDWFDTVTKDEMLELLAPMQAAINECQTRLRGSDTGDGERHAGMDMLQGIDADGIETRARVRGPAERDWDQLQDIQATVNAMAATMGVRTTPAAGG
jgi:hypothetical protein